MCCPAGTELPSCSFGSLHAICPKIANGAVVGGGKICIDGGAAFCEVGVSGAPRAAAHGGYNSAKTCQAFCADAGLGCLDGWDDRPGSMGGDGCIRFDSQASKGSLCNGELCADSHGVKLVEMAAHGCLNPMGGQVCRCGVASACGVYADFPFQWVDISDSYVRVDGRSGVGTKIDAWQTNGDNSWFDLELPFSFPWYGADQTVISIGVNGVIIFGTAHLSTGGSEPIPSSANGLSSDGRDDGAACIGNDMVSCGGLVDGLIAPYWADLKPDTTSDEQQGVFYAIDDGSASSYCPGTTSWCDGPSWQHVIVEYAEMSYGAPEAICGDCAQKIHFEAILFGDGAFMFQYKNMDPQHVSWSAESIGWEDQTGKYGMQISYGSIPAPETAYFVPACTHVLPQESDGTCPIMNVIGLDDLLRSIGCKYDASGSSCHGAIVPSNVNCQAGDSDYAGGHFASCRVVGMWHLDGNGIDAGPGQIPMVPKINEASHLTTTIYVDGVAGLGYYGAGGHALLVEDPPGTTDSVIDLVHVTMMAWVNPVSHTGLEQRGAYGHHQQLVIICKEEAYGIALHTDSSGFPPGTFTGAYQTSGNNNGWAWSDGDGIAPENAWTHVTGAQDGEAGETKFINGEPTSCTNCAHNTGNLRTDKPFPLKIGARVHRPNQGNELWTQIVDENTVGAYGDMTTTHSTPFHGSIDEVILFNRALTADEVVHTYMFYDVSRIGQQCQVCEPGRYDHDANVTSPCESCPAGTYQEQPGATECMGCPAGRVSLPGSASLDSCCAAGTQTSPPPSHRYLFDGNADDSSGANHGTVAGAARATDRFGTSDSAYYFAADLYNNIIIPSPFVSGEQPFAIEVWLSPSPGSFDSDWHGFVGIQVDGTRSPSMYVNYGGNHDVYDCNPTCNNDDATSDDGTTNDPDGLAQSGVHYDTRTSQLGDGARFAGVVDGVFAVDTYVHLLWEYTAASRHYIYKNGRRVANRPAPPIGVDVHDEYAIGAVGGDSFFTGVIDEVKFYNFQASEWISLGSSPCSRCSLGRYDHDAHAASPCASCPADTYQDQPGATSCTACLVGRTSLPDSASADACCATGTYTSYEHHGETLRQLYSL
jgi:hypothetical protein